MVIIRARGQGFLAGYHEIIRKDSATLIRFTNLKPILTHLKVAISMTQDEENTAVVLYSWLQGPHSDLPKQQNLM